MSDSILIVGDNRRTLRALADNSVDAVVCDPPYGLGKEPDMAEVLRHWINGDDHDATGGGFMGKSWDSFVPGPATWSEVFRVLKPGGHVLAFSGTRTFDMATLAMRLAGFEIRDCLSWMYGQGFPKSMDISKAIDKAGGSSPVEQSSLLKQKRLDSGLSRREVADSIGCTESSVRDWEEGRSRAVGRPLEFITPSHEYRLALAELLGYSSDERRVVGVSVDRVGDGTIIGLGHTGVLRDGSQTDEARRWDGWGTALKPAWEPIILARKPVVGTVAANVLLHGTGAINIDATRISTTDALGGGAEKETRADQKGNEGWERPWMSDPEMQAAHAATVRANVQRAQALGRFPANVLLSHAEGCEQEGSKTVRSNGHYPSARPGTTTITTDGHAGQEGLEESYTAGEVVEVWSCVDDCPIKLLDEQSGVSTSQGGRTIKRSGGGNVGSGKKSESIVLNEDPGFGDKGGASRFFYCGKVAKKERNAGMPEWVQLTCPECSSETDKLGGWIDRRKEPPDPPPPEQTGGTSPPRDTSEEGLTGGLFSPTSTPGSNTMDPSRPDTKSTTSMETSSTTASTTSNSSLPSNTNGFTADASFGTESGGSHAGDAESSSPSTSSTGTSAQKGGPSTEDADPATSGSSLTPSACAVCGHEGVMLSGVVKMVNDHPT